VDSSPPASTHEWLDSICSSSVVPDRGMPTMKIGFALRSAKRDRMVSISVRVKTSISRSTATPKRAAS
jgi:hypothetical protein